MAEEILKAKDPELHRALTRGGNLNEHLDRLAGSARSAFNPTVDEILKGNPGLEAWAMQAAQELIVRDILDPTT
jgi:hypothetical protein